MAMKKKLKNIVSYTIIFCALLAAGGLITLLSSCETPMGLGKPVDTTAPSIFFVTPINNQFLDGIIIHAPITMTGEWLDDFGVTELEFEIYNQTDRDENNKPKKEIPKSLDYIINTDGTWSASFVLDKDYDADCDYDIKVIARDGFNNAGSSTIRVRIEIVPPWIEAHRIIRHPGTSWGGFSALLQNRRFYENLNFDDYGSERNISYDNIDLFQNESFRLEVDIVNSYSGVAASRLIIMNDKGEPLKIGDQGLAPTGLRGGNDIRRPYWDIPASTFSTLGGGAHFIQFQVLAWSSSSWDGDSITGSPKPDEPYRKQMCMENNVIVGTVWHNQSDRPKVSLKTSDMLGGLLTLPPNRSDALMLNFYDDDRINEVYAGIVTKAAFDGIRGTKSEEEFIELLESSTDDSARTAAKGAVSNVNRFTDTITTPVRSRLQEVTLGTTGFAEGEYRLIAFVKENKSSVGGENYTFSSTTETWTSYPMLRIQVQNMDVPIIIIENPDRENIFPTLNDGEGFRMRGYILDSMGAESMQIAWSPTVTGITAASAANITSAINTVHGGGGTDTGSGNGGKYTRVVNHDITVWEVALSQEEKPIWLNGQNYFKSNFDQYFHIAKDFMRGTDLTGPTTNNQIQVTGTLSPNLSNKDFTIVARKTDTVTSTRTFRINANTAGPNVEVTSHGRGSNHDRDKELDLRMRVTPGQGGVKISETQPPRIYDSTGTSGTNPPTSSDNTTINKNDGYFDNITLVSGSEYYRKIASDTIKNGKPSLSLPQFDEGTKRTYIFEAFNILGVRSYAERDIVMSNRPILQSITCTNGEGTYGIGTKLTFEVTFSMPVQVPTNYLATARPALRLYTSATATADPSLFREAQFESAAGSTAVFTYTVAENDTAVKLYTETRAESQNESLVNRIFTNHASIRSSTNDQCVYIIDDANSLQRISVGIKGTRPTVQRAAFMQTTGSNGISFYNNGKNITIKLYMSEEVQVSGTPQARIQYGTAATNILTADFARMGPEATPGGSKFVLFFTHTLDNAADNIALSALSLAATNFVAFSGVTAITDKYGNDLSGNLTTASMIDGRAISGSYDSERAHIKTTKPGNITYTLHATQADANTGSSPISQPTSGDLKRTGSIWLRLTGASTDTVSQIDANNPGRTHTGGRYSLYGGNFSQSVTGSTAEISDADYANRFKETYESSQYSITAWQTDIAGNSSDMAATRDVNIRSRWPELRNIDFGLPDGAYKRGQLIPIKINMSDTLVAGTNPTVTLGLAGIGAGAMGNVTIPATSVTVSGSMITLNWTVPDAPNAPTVNMKNIKLTSIRFTNINDEYTNALGRYEGTVAEDNALNTNRYRPIDDTSTFQFNRPEFSINPNRPSIQNANLTPKKIPAVDTGADLNGYILSGNSFTLDFDVNVTAVAGKTIVIRPYGNYAIPPVLSVNEFDSLLNADFRTFTASNITTGGDPVSDETKATYKKRLKDVDANDMPNPGAERGNTDSYNMYTKNTHGISTKHTNIRPDVTTKMVLDFGTDLYASGTTDNAKRLRDIFTAARWKWQMISVTSDNVEIGTLSGTTFTKSSTGSIVRVTLQQALDPGRIWEVIVPDGAFQDLAANASMPADAGTLRFWSPGTAAPIVRAERVSYDANHFGNTSHPNVALGFVSNNTGTGYPLRPPVDTRVRIDCETPGATIKYNVIRTSYTFASAVHSAGSVFTATDATDADFFGAAYTLGGATVGYTKNNLGNADGPSNVDSEGFFTGLLVPRTVNTGGTITLTNGTFTKSTLDDLGTAIRNNFATTGNAYRTVGANGTVTWNYYTGNYAIYIGDAYSTSTSAPTNITASGTGPATVDSDTHSALYTGRRDYIIAVARKDAVNNTNTTATNALAGPALTVSAAGSEGVYKTNLLYRQPRRSYTVGNTTTNNANLTRFLVQGFDHPVIPVVAGFPLRDADSTNSNGDAFNNYFSKSAYRLGSHNTDISYTTTPALANSHYIWVSWEIVTDWYQKAKGFSMNLGGNYMNNSGNNANSVAAPYGGVIYRYQQVFYN